MKLRKFNQIIKEDRFGFDDIDHPWDDGESDAKKAAELDLKTDPGYKKLTDDFEDLDYEDNVDYDDYYSKKTDRKDKMVLSEEQENIISELTYLLRKMISNAGISNFFIENEGYDISIQFIFQKVEKMKSIMRVVNVLKKISSDILIQYDSEIEFWETIKDEPMLTIDFYYSANKKGYEKNVPIF